MEPELSVVIVSYNTRPVLERCLQSLHAATRDLAHEVIVVDNGSTDDSVTLVRERYPDAVLLQNQVNLGFATANNQGMAIARAPVVLLLNSDAFITWPVVQRALAVFREQPWVGVVGTRVDNANGTLQAEYGVFPSLWEDIRVSLGFDQLGSLRRRRPVVIGPVDWVQGACMFVRATAARDVGPLDPAFFLYSEEVDWCRRFWLHGWQVWYLGDVGVVHLGGASSGSSDLRRRVYLYRSRLGLRRRLGGPVASAFLWACIVFGLSARCLVRALAQAIVRRSVGRHPAAADWQLLGAVARMDPLARWATL